jgi:hypothetical protein
MLVTSTRDNTRPLDIQFRPFAKSVRDPKYHIDGTFLLDPIFQWHKP